MNTYPRTFSHIGISVSNEENAVKFYSDFHGPVDLIEPAVIFEEKNAPIRQMCIDMLGPSWGLFKIAHVFTSDKIGVEKFEFKKQRNAKRF
ncbi:VOC family protein [Paraglaciecola psychrophila]|uniref:hypothetical protein n=1 Tax=Paraglaciecola psychrophila TaxID=326544 RepID=UPI000A8DFBB4